MAHCPVIAVSRASVIPLFFFAMRSFTLMRSFFVFYYFIFFSRPIIPHGFGSLFSNKRIFTVKYKPADSKHTVRKPPRPYAHGHARTSVYTLEEGTHLVSSSDPINNYMVIWQYN